MLPIKALLVSGHGDFFWGGGVRLGFFFWLVIWLFVCFINKFHFSLASYQCIFHSVPILLHDSRFHHSKEEKIKIFNEIEQNMYSVIISFAAIS